MFALNDEDYISLTDMIKSEEGEDHIRNWMRNKNTIEFLGTWETLYNPDFKGVEFDTFLNEAGFNRFNMTPRKWIESTNAIGIVSKAGSSDIQERRTELRKARIRRSETHRIVLQNSGQSIPTYYTKFKEFRTTSARLSSELPDIVVISSQNMTGISVPLSM